MKHLLVILSFFLFSQSFAWAASEQETYKSHTVQKGETVYSIAQQYNVSEEAIYRLNPDARKGISENSLLIIPTSNNQLKVVGYVTHKVKRKETLYGIAKKYGVTVDDIKKYNKFLYSRKLDKGDKLQIPKFEKVKVVIEKKDPEETSEDNQKTQLHEVQPKETLYGIARKYGISIADLKVLNPNLEENLPIGTQLVVPMNSVTDSAAIEEDQYDFYEVQPKEGFYRLKVKLGLSEEQIVALNPYAKDGLKEGMIIKIPKEVASQLKFNANKIDLSGSISNPDTKKIAVMLPFQLQHVNTDSLDVNKELLQNNRTLRISLDFYSGVLMAAEFAKEKGISVDLSVFDTEGSSSKLSHILNSNDFSKMDAVIGPLVSKNVERAASFLKSDNVPVISPLSNRNIKLTSNLVQTLPDEALLAEAMIAFLKDSARGKEVLIIGDAKSSSKAKVVEALPYAKVLTPREKGFLFVSDIQGKLINETENWVILESTNPITISNVVGILNGLPETYQIRLFTTDKNENFEYDDISNVHLAKLQFTFPSVSKSYDLDEKQAFPISYKEIYGVFPNRYAVRGFDVTYDILLRLANADSLYDGLEMEGETEYLENKFMYDKKLFSGYTNQAFYILKYNSELHFDIVR